MIDVELFEKKLKDVVTHLVKVNYCNVIFKAPLNY